nr:uncharacterized protein LOC115257412 [Aedes albopictus]
MFSYVLFFTHSLSRLHAIVLVSAPPQFRSGFGVRVSPPSNDTSPIPTASDSTLVSAPFSDASNGCGCQFSPRIRPIPFRLRSCSDTSTIPTASFCSCFGSNKRRKHRFDSVCTNCLHPGLFIIRPVSARSRSGLAKLQNSTDPILTPQSPKKVFAS